MQPDNVNLWYFKLTLFIVWNNKGIQHWAATILKLENQSLCQKLSTAFDKIVKKPQCCSDCLCKQLNIETETGD